MCGTALLWLLCATRHLAVDRECQGADRSTLDPPERCRRCPSTLLAGWGRVRCRARRSRLGGRTLGLLWWYSLRLRTHYWGLLSWRWLGQVLVVRPRGLLRR